MTKRLNEYKTPYGSFRTKVLDSTGEVICECGDYDLATDIAVELNHNVDEKSENYTSDDIGK